MPSMLTVGVGIASGPSVLWTTVSTCPEGAGALVSRSGTSTFFGFISRYWIAPGFSPPCFIRWTYSRAMSASGWDTTAAGVVFTISGVLAGGAALAVSAGTTSAAASTTTHAMENLLHVAIRQPPFIEARISGRGDARVWGHARYPSAPAGRCKASRGDQPPRLSGAGLGVTRKLLNVLFFRSGAASHHLPRSDIASPWRWSRNTRNRDLSAASAAGSRPANSRAWMSFSRASTLTERSV